MYSLSHSAWRRVARRLESYVSAGRVNEFYETVFAEMVAEGSLAFEAVYFDNERWYEIDTLDDLRQAECLFSNGRSRLRPGIEPRVFPSYSPRPVRDAAGRDKHLHGAP